MDIEKIKTYILSLATVPSCKPRTRGYVKKEDRADYLSSLEDSEHQAALKHFRIPSKHVHSKSFS